MARIVYPTAPKVYPTDPVAYPDADTLITYPGGAAIVAPEFVGHAIQSSGAGTVRTPDISALTLDTGYLLVAKAQIRGGGDSPTCAAPASQGWVAIPELTQTSASGFAEHRWYKYWGIGDTDDTTPSFTWSTAGTGNSADITVLRSCRQGVPYLITPVMTNQVAGVTQTTPVVGTAPSAETLTLWAWQTLDDNTLIDLTRGTLISSTNIVTVASQAVAYEIGVDSSTITASMTESTNVSDASRNSTLVIEGGPEQSDPPLP